MLFSGVEVQKNFEVPSGFELGTVVEIPGPEGQSTFGVIRWIGHLPQIKDKIIVGLELVRKDITLVCVCLSLGCGVVTLMRALHSTNL